MYDLKAILAKPLDYGFEFVSGQVRTDNGKDVLGEGPVLVVRDVKKFDTAFPGVIQKFLVASNSMRVKAQAVIREALEKNRRTPFDAMREPVLSAILGIRAASVTTVQVYVLPDGSTTTEKATALEAWKNA